MLLFIKVLPLSLSESFLWGGQTVQMAGAKASWANSACSQIQAWERGCFISTSLAVKSASQSKLFRKTFGSYNLQV